MESTTHYNWSDIWQIENTNDEGYGEMDHYAWYGVGLVVVATLGCTGNFLSLCIFLHPSMRSPYGVYVCALLIVDVAFLIFTCLVHVPGAHLTKIAVYEPEFWDALSRGQNIYIMAYGIADLANALVTWYTVALLAEQFCVIYKPTAALRFSSTSEKVMKICITILNVTILIHLVHFFKLVSKPIDIEDWKRICLSDIYTSDIYRLYDNYIYFIFFVLSAWFTSVVFCLMIALAVITSRYNIGEVLRDQKIFRVFKNGRSIRTSLTLGIWYIICYAVVNVCYIVTWFYKPWDANPVDCQFRPVDPRFNHTPSFIRILHDVFVVLNSSLRFPMMFVANSNFRRIFSSCFHVRPEVVETVSSMFSLRTESPNPVLQHSNRAYVHSIHDLQHHAADKTKQSDNKAQPHASAWI